ncbi:hypothetical protein AVEN_258267-1 [Araneus ventricosus]|uniref:Uncharacterized protein n=1 Tax=Araneus ventricosus TaxID=182803 RepID=A0A4Y2M0K2_ARAVE|nr:hypothetical protein AVEN_258267-1 [Araneus ventricosus]
MTVRILKAGHSPSLCSSPHGGLLSRLFTFSAHKIWWDIQKSDCASRTYGQLDPLSYGASSFPRFQNGSSRPDFPRMTPIHTSSFYGSRFCERGSGPLTDYHILVLWPGGPNGNPTWMEFQLFSWYTQFLIGF